MKKRVVYFDYLRVVAIIAVIILHVTSGTWYKLSGRSFAWNVLNFYNGNVRWGVPVFVMISGALFLSRDVDMVKIYKKNISKLLVAYIVWSIFYAITTPLIEYIFSKNLEFSIREIVSNIIDGHFHMWFIPMIVGLYMCIPIINGITHSTSTTKYYLVLSFTVSFVVPQIMHMANDFAGNLLAVCVNVLNGVISDKMKLYFALGFAFYFVLGYSLQVIELTRKQRGVVYVFGCLGLATTVGLNAIVAWKTDEPCSTYYGEFCVNTLVVAIAVYTWFKYREYNNEKMNALVAELSKCSFGAYLNHIFVLTILQKVGIHTLMYSPIISVPVISILTIVLSFLISWLLNKIPVINKWIV